MVSDDYDELQYLCGACKQMRDEENIEMIADPDPRFGEYPVCSDKSECTIEAVVEQRDGGAGQFEITDTLE